MLPTEPVAVPFDESISRSADDIGHLQRRPAHLLSRRVAGRSVVASPKDSRLRSDGAARDASRWSFLSGLDDRGGPEWRGDRRQPREGVWQNSDGEDEDEHAWGCRPA